MTLCLAREESDMTYNHRPHDDAQSYYRVIEDFYPKRETEVSGFRVSSLYRYIGIVSVNQVDRPEPYLANETCVFSPHDAGLLTDSLVIGTYHDHDDIVKAINIILWGSDADWIDSGLDHKRRRELGLGDLVDFLNDCLSDDRGLLSPDESLKFLESLIEKGQ
jgi:hypothetical protein